MPVNQTSIAQVLAKTCLSNQDKKAMTQVIGGLTDDVEQLRAAVAVLTAKLDAAGATVAGLGTNFVATTAIPKTNMNIKR